MEHYNPETHKALKQKHWRLKKEGRLDPEWSEFEAFFRWAVENGWAPGCEIRTVTKRGRAGPDTCYFMRAKDDSREIGDMGALRIDADAIKGGWNNRPCIECETDEGSCTSSNGCTRYKLWIIKSWDLFNAYARKYGGTA